MTQPTHGDDTVKDLVQQHWNSRAATFDEESQHGIHSDDQHDRWLTVLREWTGDDSLHVLNVGCGTGVLSLLLAELNHDVVGVDFAPEMLEYARAKARQTDRSITFQRGDAETLAPATRSVDPGPSRAGRSARGDRTTVRWHESGSALAGDPPPLVRGDSSVG